MPNALITGITGQDGVYLAQYLLGKRYTVWGVVREGGPVRLENLEAVGVSEAVRLLPLDHTDQASIRQALRLSQPDEIYNLVAQSSVAGSYKDPVGTGDLSGLFVVRLLEAMRQETPTARMFQASSAEMYGHPRQSPLRETTPLQPLNPYGAAKAFAHWTTVNYRSSFSCHTSCGILFNHESPLRPEHFVARKVTLAVARIKAGLQSSLALGNLEVERDWGFAPEFVQAMWLMLQQETPDDYVIATGQSYKLREFVAAAFAAVDLNYQDYVHVDPAFLRPAEALRLVACTEKARAILGWEAKTKLEGLVQVMVEADLERVSSLTR